MLPSHSPRRTCARRTVYFLTVTSVWLLQRYGRCAPRGTGGSPDRTIATVVKAPDGVGLAATSAETDAAQRGVRVISRTHLCAVVHRAMVEELVRYCGSPGKLQQSRTVTVLLLLLAIPVLRCDQQQGMVPIKIAPSSPPQTCSCMLHTLSLRVASPSQPSVQGCRMCVLCDVVMHGSLSLCCACRHKPLIS